MAGLVFWRRLKRFSSARRSDNSPLTELDTWREQVEPTVTQIIYNNSACGPGQPEAGNGTPYIPRTAGNQYLHKNTVLSGALWFTVSLLQ